MLDSSFNPPTSAHLSLLLNHPKSKDSTYDSHLLLFSTLNADKGTGKKGDATTLQRIELMEILAKEALERLKSKSKQKVKDGNENDKDEGEPSIAIGIVDQPLIATKSTLIHQYLKENNFNPHSGEENHGTVLHYLVGADTLPRFFTPKYYDPPDGTGLNTTCEQLFQVERTKLICARRLMVENSTNISQDEIERKRKEEIEKEKDLLNSHYVQKWYQKGFIEIHDLLKEDEMQFSSTEIRNLVMDLLEDGRSQEDREKFRKRLESCTVEGVREYILKEKVYVKD